jgi:hypothetical protein
MDTNPLSKLKLDYWYHVLMVVGVVAFLAAGTGVLKEFPTVPTALISLGVFLFGLGEWMNHPLKTAIREGNAFHPIQVISGYPRSNKPLGMLFDLLGLGLAGWGVVKLIA